MANYANLKSAIQQVIKTNGNNEITGALLQQSLLAIITSLGGYYQFAGIATPSTNPGTPDQNVFYIGGAGTYSNFSSLVIPTGYIGVLKYNGTWTLETVQAGDVNAVKFVAQTLTDNQKTQARTNIEAASSGQVSQLEAKLNNLANTRYYGIFTSSADLPADASENGYAYVGSSTPLAIYEFDGEDWNDTGVTVNSIQGEPGVGFESVTTNEDGSFTIHLTDGGSVTIDLTHNHPDYYSKVVGTSQPSGGFLPDVAYNLGEISGTVAFILASAVTGKLNHYFWMFDTGATAPTITWPSGITWADSAPTITASKKYQISILDGIAAYMEA